MNIKVVQDLICPWCYIGHHNLDRAIAGWTAEHGGEFELRWLPYQLDPMSPGTPPQEFRQRFKDRKHATDEQIDAMFERVTHAGAAAGITFRFDLIEVAVDTLPGHIAIATTPSGKRPALIQALYQAYFEEGKDIGSAAQILDAATIAGLDDHEQTAIVGALADDAARANVESQIRQVQAAGVTGVPYFVIDDKFGLSGAQQPEAFTQTFARAHEPALA
jgi:predicted DsbA family dithiol-disulfide isomerase